MRNHFFSTCGLVFSPKHKPNFRPLQLELWEDSFRLDDFQKNRLAVCVYSGNFFFFLFFLLLVWVQCFSGWLHLLKEKQINCHQNYSGSSFESLQQEVLLSHYTAGPEASDGILCCFVNFLFQFSDFWLVSMFLWRLVFAWNALDISWQPAFVVACRQDYFKITFFLFTKIYKKYSNERDFNLEKSAHLGWLCCFKTLINLTFFSECKSFN